MPRKGNNIYKRKDGRWEARYIKEVNIDGKKKYGSVYGATYAEAREKQLLRMRNPTLPGDRHTGETLSSVAHEWLKSRAHGIKNSTYQKYSGVITHHIDTHMIGSLPLRLISYKAYGEYANQKVDSGLSAKTVNDIMVVIRSVTAYAAEVYGIQKVKLPRIKEPKTEMRVLSVAEQKRLEQYLYDNMCLYSFGILLALYTGIRVGELCALQWDDITDNSLTVSKTLHRIRNGSRTILEFTEPKTPGSNRRIPLPGFLHQYIERFRGSGSVLKNRNQKPVEPRLMQMTFKKMVEECDLPETNFHALRHTFATRCIEVGFDVKSLSEILGHSDVKTTLNQYVHSSYELKQKNMAMLVPLGKA